MAVTFVHSLWGNEQATSWPSALMNIVDIGTARRQRICPGQLKVFAWGEQNYRFLWSWGFDPVLVSPDPRGNWYYKLQSMLLAFESGATSVCWMDLDTIVCHSKIKDWRPLEHGSSFQGRLFKYRRRHPVLRSKVTFRGGCMLVRDASFIVDAMELMMRRGIQSDEVALTLTVAARLFGGRWEDGQHQMCRDLGLDNCRLYQTRNDVIPQSSSVAALCTERRVVRRMTSSYRGPWREGQVIEHSHDSSRRGEKDANANNVVGGIPV